MTTYRLGSGDDVFVVNRDDITVLGQAGNDTIDGSGSRLLLDGGRGDDAIGWLNGNHVTAGGGWGEDRILLLGEDDVLRGGRGDDHLRAEGRGDSLYGETGNDTVDAGYGGSFLAHGGRGDDSVTGACGKSELYGDEGDDFIRLAEGSDNNLYGGAGNDTLSGSTLECHNNTLHGGGGDDTLAARDSRNILDGGDGDDRLSSIIHNWIHQVGDGTTLVGGDGRDTFAFENPLHLSVTNDVNAALSPGDVIAGGIDQVTDYKAGETIDLFGQGLRQVTSVGLADPAPGSDTPENPQEHQHVVLGAQTYAVFQGQLTAPGTFTVSANGDDTIVVYGADYGAGELSTGAVVLEHFTGDVLIV